VRTKRSRRGLAVDQRPESGTRGGLSFDQNLRGLAECTQEVINACRRVSVCSYLGSSESAQAVTTGRLCWLPPMAVNSSWSANLLRAALPAQHSAQDETPRSNRFATAPVVRKSPFALSMDPNRRLEVGAAEPLSGRQVMVGPACSAVAGSAWPRISGSQARPSVPGATTVSLSVTRRVRRRTRVGGCGAR
jgi:hypothetical protein